MSRHWRAVSKTMQKLATGLHEVKCEGMSPYETYYVLATADSTISQGTPWRAASVANPEPSADVPKSS
jgi:hypothetical protein